MSLILTIDIGNTRAKYAVFDGNNIIKSSVFNPYSNDLKELTKNIPGIKGVSYHLSEAKSENVKNNWEIWKF